MRTMLTLLIALTALTGCGTLSPSPRETVLPVFLAWVEGRQVEYLVTDISDAAMAAETGTNFVPRLRDAVGVRPSVLERVYKFRGKEQITLFPSAPQPVGPGNADRAYSPLWRVVWVTWREPAKGREFRDEESLLAAEEKGLVSFEITDIVINCPVTRAVGGGALRGVR